jgi:tetratricopeptide (TPR) repeat protein
LGLGHSLCVKTIDDHSRRRELLNAAAECFTQAVAADPDDHLPRYYLAYHLANTRHTAAAASHARAALDLHQEHQPSMHLTALLLSAQQEYQEALELTDFALEEYPDSYPLMQLKVHLEEKANGGESAILTAKGIVMV